MQQEQPGKYGLMCKSKLLVQQQGLAEAVTREEKPIKLPLEGSAGTGDGLDPDLPVDLSTGVARRLPQPRKWKSLSGTKSQIGHNWCFSVRHSNHFSIMLLFLKLLIHVSDKQIFLLF